MIVINNCFHWIGYHLLQKFLEGGYEVMGCDPITSEKREHLSMFVGRNSHFEWMETLPDARKKESDIIYIDVQPHVLFIQLEDNQTHTISTPMLFGEFMDREDDGFEYKDTFISFESKKFNEEAVWIEDFVDILFSLFKENQLNKDWKVKSLSKSMREEEDGDEVIYVRQTDTVSNRLQLIDEHYQQYTNLY
ncbi:hypothetical protein KO561_06340 [Radiobacillus kanasensis]|uniref:hypothetical protein n=1 Tax=Radiobacillus kanasensis TaxID=2844358 RepID=UPI001E30E66B|nr:hypothetical protein [Radiobacillus kanasensis]UFU00557.1 hypothetical protein KO561_06340 [Radiobacillus kanasensis]